MADSQHADVLADAVALLVARARGDVDGVAAVIAGMERPELARAVLTLTWAALEMAVREPGEASDWLGRAAVTAARRG